MGKATGFLDYQRTENLSVSPLDRINNFNEFHPPLAADERRRQGARCMNCGVPFCQSALQLKGMVTGCPLHNLIPEWNDAIYHGNDDHALSRLLKTNNFPEFTGRVCPALCEKACICGMNGDSVTVHDNELFIIETAFKENYMKPRKPNVCTGKKVAVVGSGPSGLAVADQLNHRGHKVTVFEKANRPGGLLMYGIPNMKLDKRIVRRRIQLMTEEGVTFITNTQVGESISAKQLLDAYDAVILCCGSGRPRDLAAENREGSGVYFAVDFLSAATKQVLYDTGVDTDALDCEFISAKDKHVVIVGGGDTGNDCVGTCIRHGAKSDVQLEMMPKLPDTRAASNPWPEWPKVCKTDYGQEEAIAVFGHDPRIYQTTVKELVRDDEGRLTGLKTVRLSFEHGSPEEIEGSEAFLECDLLLIAAGFTGCTDDIAQAFNLELTSRHTAASEPGSYKTNVEKVFTAGDMHRGQSLVVWAIAEGRACAKEVDEYLMGYTNME